jgi:hypothetical protein
MVQVHRVAFWVVVAGCIAALGLTVIANASDDDRPSSNQVAFAQQVCDLTHNHQRQRKRAVHSPDTTRERKV